MSRIDEAAGWHTRLGRGLTDRQRGEFESWIADPANALEFDCCRTLLDMAMELKGRARAEVLASIEPKPALPWLAALREWLASGSAWVSGAACAAALLVIAMGWSLLRSQGYVAQTFRTATGQIRNVVLPDGSIVGLNTQTELEWVGSPHDRRVRLIRGEAYFQVVHDPSRPFRILLAHSEVQVLGTRFDVYQMANGDVRVSVVSGTVAVEGLDSGVSATPSWSRRLTAGQQIEYSPVGLVADVHAIQAQKIIRWREGIIETQGEPLSEFVSDLSRYTTQRMFISDSRAANQKVGGVFSIYKFNETLNRLGHTGQITVTQANGEVIFGYRPAAAVPLPGAPAPR